MPQSPSTSEHPTFLTASIVVCENVLAEAKGLLSAIRIADTFSYVLGTDGDPKQEPHIRFYVISSVRLKPHDESEHLVELKLLRPDGTSEVVAHGSESPPPMGERMFPDLPTGLNLMGQIAIRVACHGTHYLILILDGTEVSKALFSIVEKPQSANQE